MQHIDTLIFPSWLIPIEPHGQVLEQHALAVDQGKILAILPQEEARTTYSAKETLELNDHVLLPGFINTHTHSPMALMRGVGNDLPLMDWLNNYIWPLEKKWMHEDYITDGTKLALAEMIRCGTTCFLEHYFFPGIIAEVADKAKIRAAIGATILDFPTNWSENAIEALKKVADLYPKYKNHSLLSIAIGPHAPYTLSNNSLEQIKKISTDLNIPLFMHVHETPDEIAMSLKEFNKRPLKRLKDLGLLSKNLVCIHMANLNDEDIALAKESGVQVVHCPESNLKLASGFCPVQKLLDAGINVALGTDSAASNNDLDIIAEMRTASLLAKGVSADPTALSATTALRMLTINGAKAMGLENTIGSLEPGKAADMVSIDMAALETQPMYDPIAHIVYAAARNQVKNVWVAGKKLLHNGKLTTLDEEKILAQAKIWQKKMSESL